MNSGSPFLDVFLPVAPVVVPLLAAIIGLLLYKGLDGQRIVGIISLVANLAGAITLLCFTYGAARDDVGGVVVSQIGNWPAPFGISVVIDTLAALLLVVAATVALGIYCYVLSQTPLRFASGYFHPLYQMLILGVNWAFITGDLFNLFVAFEVMLLASYVLLVNGTTTRQMRQAYKYVVLNLVVSAAFVAGCGWLYGTLGTLNFAELALLSREGKVGGQAALAAAVLLMTFGTKAAAFPLWFWLPDTYPTLPPAMAGLFAALLTKVGIYAILRVFVMCFHQAQDVADAVAPLILLSAGATMLIGVLGAVASRTVRRILSNNLVSHLGYMILGIGLASGFAVSNEAAEFAIAATVLYMIQHMVVKGALFLSCGMIEKYAGTDDLDKFGAIVRRDRLLSALFLIAALSLAGLPPLSGFFGKLLLITASFRLGTPTGYVLGGIAILTGALTLLSIARIWCYGFWSEPPADRLSAIRPPEYSPPRRLGGLLPLAALVIVSLSMGLFAHRWYDITKVAARGIVQPDSYVRAVLGAHAADGNALKSPAVPDAREAVALP